MKRLGLAAAVLIASTAGLDAVAAEGAERTRLHRFLEEKLSAAVRGEVRFGTLDVSVTGLEARFTDARLTMPVEDAPPLTLRAGSGTVKLAWSSLAAMAAGRIRLEELSLDAPEATIDARWVEAFARRPRTAAAVQVELGRVRIAGGSLSYLDAAQKLDVRLSEASFDGSWDAYRHALVGPLQAKGRLVRPPIVHPLPFEASGVLRWAQRGLDLDRFQLRAAGLGASLDGAVRLAGATSFSADAEVSGPIAGLQAHLGDFPPIGGRARATLRIDKQGPGFLVLGEAHVENGRLGPLAAEVADARISIDSDGIELRDLRARTFGGEVRGSVDVALGAPLTFRVDAAGTGIDARAVLDLAKLPFPIVAKADGTFVVSGEPARPETWQGTATFTATPGSGGGLPAGGEGTVRFTGGRVVIPGANLRLAGARLAVDVDARLGEEGAPTSVKLSGSTSDAAATQRGTLAILASLDVDPPEIVRRPLSGSGTLASSIGLGDAPTFDLLLDLRGGTWDGEAFEEVHLDVGLAEREVTIRSLHARDGGAAVDGEARLAIDEAKPLEALRVSARDLPLARLLTRAGVEVQADGLVSAELDLRAGPGGFVGGGSVALRETVLVGESVDAASARVEVEGDRWRFLDVTARGPAIDLSLDVDVDAAAGTAEGNLREGVARLESLAALGAAGLEGAGEIRLTGPFSWGGEGPRASFETRGHDARLAKAGFGLSQHAPTDLDGTLRLDDAGAHVSLGAGTEGRWSVEATVGWGKDLPVEAELHVRDVAFGGAAAGVGASVTLTAAARVTGPMARPAELAIEGAAERFSVQVGPRTLVAEGAIPLQMTGGVLAIGPAALRGEASRFDAELSVAVETGSLDGRLDGTLDLSVVGAFWRSFRAAGTATAALEIGGTLEAPRVEGTIDVDGARLRAVGFPQPLEELRALFVFEGDAVRLDGASAQMGGGQVLAQGTWRLSGEEAGRYDLSIDATRVTLAYPAGFRGIYDADLRLTGNADRSLVTGRVEVVQGLYDRDFDVGTLFTETERSVSGDSEESLLQGVALDVDVVADGNVWMHNNLGRLEARATIDVGGSLARPEITGRVELLEGGKLRFRGVDYQVDTGTVDLVDRQRLRPVVDFLARTRVKEYEIELHVEGEIDKLNYELTSYPALSEQDIIAVLVTGETIDELSADTTSTALSSDVAATYFAGFVTGRFAKPVERALRLEQFQITPLVSPGQSDPTARITAAKQIGQRLRIAYSVDLGAVDSEIYQLEWDMTRRFRFLLESSAEAGFGGDVTYTTRFGGGGGGGAAPATSRSRVLEARAASVSVEGVEPKLAKDLLDEIPVREGQAFTRGDLYQASDAIRRALVKRGHLEARVEPVRGAVEAELPAATGELPVQRVTFVVDPGPKVEVRIEASSWRERRRISSRLDRFWLDSLFSIDLYSEAAEQIRRDLQDRGRYTADVEHVHEKVDEEETRLRFLVEPGPEVVVEEVRLEGVASLPMERVRSVFLTRSKGILGGGELVPEILAEDVRALRSLYRQEGFLAVRVPAPSVSLGLDGKHATIVIHVEEGARHHVGSVEVPDGLSVPAATLREWTGLAPGQVFSTVALLRAETTLHDRLDKAGYPEAVVSGSYALHDAVADVAFRVETGGFRRIAGVSIEGATRTKPKIVNRELQFREGEPLSRDALIATQQRLYRLGIFRTVRLDWVPAGGDDPAAQTVRVRLEESPPLSLSVGPGWTSEEGARVTFALTHSNLGGYDRTAGIQGKWSELEQRIQLFAKEPRVFGRPIEGIGSFSWEDTEIAGFRVDRRSTAARFLRKVNPRWTRLIRYNFQKVDVEPGENPDVIELLEQKITNLRLGDVGLAFTRDTRDDPFLPTRGGLATAELRVFAPVLFSDESFAKLFLQGTLTRGARDKGSYAISLRLGFAETWSETAFVPLSERYFAGGDSTIRGFPRDGVGDQVEGVALGGEALILLNQEVRVKVWRSLKGVVFLDVGNTYLKLDDLDLSNLRESAGVGLRFESPIGPIRLEYGWKLDRREGESAGEAHLAIGAVF